MLAHQRFMNAVLGVLPHIDENPLILPRLSSLTLSGLLIDPNAIKDSCGFILQLVTYADDVSVFSLFEALCGPNEELKEVQQWLIDVGFIQVLIKELESMYSPALKNCGRTDHNGSLLVAYYNIIKIASSSKILRKEVKLSSVLAVLNRDLGELPSYIEDARWEAMASLACAKTFDVMRTLFQESVEMITDPKRVRTRASVSALHILAFMIKFDPIIPEFVLYAKLPKVTTDLMKANPDHSILHAAATYFLMSCLENPVTMTNTMNEIASFVLYSMNQSNRNIAATGMNLLSKVSDAEKVNEDIFNAMNEVPGFVKEVKDPFAVYVRLLDDDYGGPMPIFSVDNANKLALLTMKMMRAW
ncbi:hypothetical protein TVAG_412940 [Trichomonas vaginalis G3]|uniref:Uncharacterized protein n=1 Tax=Trichomonas vaginalis (strain ATCC PRA-98 / G3) TaxID=412133 RepID=A2F6I0_TRIV3|nr:hypothetical protein TVAGG3_0002250 [Trichomonas vaginalis G3]EAX99478.1 hypothetical protein TVAG_412940 [Trichomonas vaginalis G3]KAI5538697.1 hypothetical protein TVAGG3_0002250 [Trichomonas vaginalis G3]|eukprot:XP_001312408.1 hypothetical protein [Trichomonas vaginalis G3]